MNTAKTRLFEGKGTKGAGTGGDGGGSDAFNGNRAISRQIPSLEGVNPSATTIVSFLNNVFYPAIAPDALLNIDNPVREIGQSTAYTLTWDVLMRTNGITGITVDGTVITPTGGNQGGMVTGNFPTADGTYLKSMSVTDGNLSTGAEATVSYLPRMFWGTTSKDGLSDAPILDSDILALSGSELRSTRNKSFSGLGGGGTYIIFAFPAYFGTPQFVVNGLVNTAFTKVRANSNFVNAQGATIPMDVWVSDNLYNSPLDSVVIN